MISLSAVALVAGAVWNPLSYFLLAVNRHEGFTYFYAAAAIGAVVLSFYFVRHWGVTGAAAAGLILDSAMLVCALLQMRRLIGVFPFGLKALHVLVPNRLLRRRRSKISRRIAKE